MKHFVSKYKTTGRIQQQITPGKTWDSVACLYPLEREHGVDIVENYLDWGFVL